MTETNTNKITIETADGVATIDAKLFQGYRDELFKLYSEMENTKENIKGCIEAVADATQLSKATCNKFFKAAYDAKIAEQSEQAELFEELLGILA